MASDASEALADREIVQQFLNAACTGNVDLLKKLAGKLDEGKGLAKTVADIKDANKRGALHFAARENQTEMCKFLLEELKLDVDTKDEDGDTPLIHAARLGHTNTAKLLLDYGANPSIASDLGATALHHSAGLGNIELLRDLISKGVDVNSQSDAGSPLIWAAGHDQPEAVKVLLEHKADANSGSDDDITPLMSSVAAGSLACLELLVQAGAKVNMSAGGATPLHIAADVGSSEIIKSLLSAGADPNVESRITKEPNVTKDYTSLKKDLPEVTPEAKKKAAEAKSRGGDAFSKKDYHAAIDAYTQAIDLDPTDAVFLSNRSLCWLRLGQPEHALADAKACRALNPEWPKACFREGAALRLMQKFDEAANCFYEGVQLDPNSRELVDAFREAVDAGRQFHGKNKQKPKP